ncbi:transcriptional regulator [Lichenihabitans sp. PAMC28606]|uniref:3'-5' exonuclease n=1 Tax=Lichenihabitans sp. PAMC28606 TaxID=2880932 RepID=UPI001D0A3718|nr:transcriptional regulator [Lichenihabitans sp. PAMC28606]UDL94621.1 transcriptional regulator [Lichenihabitans sp. PAMC28606]
MSRIAFLDFEASSLGKKSYPIEVAWVFDDGSSEATLIRPAPGWTDWASDAEAIHGIPRDLLLSEGQPHDVVGRRMIACLTGHTLYASAPSWDGQWLSRLLRAADLPRHALRLQDTDEAQRRVVIETCRAAGLSPGQQNSVLNEVLSAAARDGQADGPPAHRALADARQEYERWRAIRHATETAVRALASELPGGP